MQGLYERAQFNTVIERQSVPRSSTLFALVVRETQIIRTLED
jgi:hypothetical protein